MSSTITTTDAIKLLRRMQACAEEIAIVKEIGPRKAWSKATCSHLMFVLVELREKDDRFSLYEPGDRLHDCKYNARRLRRKYPWKKIAGLAHKQLRRRR